MATFPEASRIIQCGDGTVLVFTCEHKDAPKKYNPEKEFDFSPIYPTESCDYFENKLQFYREEEHPNICFNCKYSVALKVDQEKSED